MQTHTKLNTNLHFTRKITGFIDLKQDLKMPHLDMQKSFSKFAHMHILDEAGR